MILNHTPIQIEWFYHLYDEKSKLNWFLLEIALEYYDRIMNERELASYREQNDEKQIAQYCAYYARRLKESLLKNVRGQRKTVRFYREYASDFYPHHDAELNVVLSRLARESFEYMWPGCRVCPQQCIWEYEDISPLFDEYQD
jgi:hypothetical protein